MFQEFRSKDSSFGSRPIPVPGWIDTEPIYTGITTHSTSAYQATQVKGKEEEKSGEGGASPEEKEKRSRRRRRIGGKAMVSQWAVTVVTKQQAI